MPFDAGTARGKLELDTGGFVSALTSARTSLNGFLRGAANIGGTALIAGFGAAAAGAVALTAAVLVGSKANAEYEQTVVGLSNVLKAQGVAGYKAITAEIEEFATALQRTTGIADEEIVKVTRQLATMGVAAKNLRPAVKTVLDFAAATGQPVLRSLRAFGGALQGNAGALARFLPGVRQLTEAQLKAGAAFDLASKAAAGQSEVLGQTFTGRVQRLSGSIEDFLETLGSQFNRAFGPLITEVQTVIDSITDRLSSGAGFDALAHAADVAAASIKAAMEGTLVSVFQVVAGIKGTAASIESFFATVAEFRAEHGFFNTKEQKAQLEGVARSARQIADELQAGADKAQAMADRLDLAQRQGKGLAAQVGFVVDGLIETLSPANKLKEKAGGIAGEFVDVADSVEKAAQTLAAVTAKTGGAARAATATRDLWKAVNEQVQATDSSVDGVTSSTRQASDAADDLSSSYEDAAASAGNAAAAASSAANETIKFLSASRQVVSSQSLDFSDPFRAAGLATSANQSLQRVSGGGQSAFAGRTTINAANAFADGVNAAAQASIDAFIADFTNQILAELNAQGIFDPATRSRILRERLAEARRLGTIPEIGSAL